MKSEFTLDIIERENEGATYEGLQEIISGNANCRYIYDGNEDEGFGWDGQVIEMILTAEKGLSRIGNIIGEQTHR